MKSSTSNKLTIYAGTAVLLAVFAIAAGVLAGAQFAVPIVILAALVLGFLMLNSVLARRADSRAGRVINGSVRSTCSSRAAVA